MVFVTGDCHGDWHKFNTAYFPIQKELTRDDIVIVCGDFGLWHDTPSERFWLKWLSEKPFTVVFVDGNHENFDRLYSDEFPVVNFKGGKAHKIMDNIYHLMRGYIFEIEGKSFFAFGGASCHDIQDGVLDREDFDSDYAFKEKCKEMDSKYKMYRVNHISWWEQELPSELEMNRGIKNLQSYGSTVDFVITHCLPQSVVALFSYGLYESDVLTRYFDKIASGTTFKQWYCGHYHTEDTFLSKYHILYDRIERII